MDGPVTKVLIVDDHDFVRLGIKSTLDSEQDIEVIGEAKSGEEAIKALHSLIPDIVLMDVKMPGMGGLEAVRRMLVGHPDLKIIVVTMYDKEPVAKQMLSAGAMGFILKDEGSKELINAIRLVSQGEHYITSKVAHSLAIKNLNYKHATPMELLSEREFQIMFMIANGQTVQNIAQNLHLSTKTINSYRYRLFEKLKITTDVAITRIAIEYGIVDI